MKSSDSQRAITFFLLQERLLGFVLQRVKNGDFTERGLARLIGVSQPQIHNVLKGKRRLQPSLADRIMEKFEIEVLDLLHDHELRSRLVTGAIQDLSQIAFGPIPGRKGPAREKKINPNRKDRTG